MDDHGRELTPREEEDIALWQATEATNPALAFLMKAELRRRYEGHIKNGVPGPKRAYELGLM